MKQIGLALANYREVYGTFPPAYLTDDAGRPMHSWRVLILPYLGEKDLYERYRFDEPWNGPNNSRLHNEYAISRLHNKDPTWAFTTFHCHEDLSPVSNTSYLAVIGPQTVWSGTGSGQRGADSRDVENQILIVVESVNSGIHWMEPRDLKIDTMSFKIDGPAGKSVGGNHPLKFGWFGNHGRCAHAVSADGRRVRCLSDETSPDELRSMLINDGSEMGGPSR